MKAKQNIGGIIKMTVQSYLDKRASDAVLSESEKSSIETSITTLQIRLRLHFEDRVSTHFKFGSSTRNTILPRVMDSRSDIDYMVVFKDEDSQPQTYIHRIKVFAEKYYSSSEISQSTPTVVLKLNHISFDLVPAIKSYVEEYRIPAPSSSYQNWVATSPNDFNSKLIAANVRCGSKLKPTIRLLKYWNANSGYIFDSYGLEKWVSEQYFSLCTTTKDYLFSCFDKLTLDSSAAQWRKDKLNRAKTIVSKVREYENDDMPYTAESEVQKLIPNT